MHLLERNRIIEGSPLETNQTAAPVSVNSEFQGVVAPYYKAQSHITVSKLVPYKLLSRN